MKKFWYIEFNWLIARWKKERVGEELQKIKHENIFTINIKNYYLGICTKIIHENIKKKKILWPNYKLD